MTNKIAFRRIAFLIPLLPALCLNLSGGNLFAAPASGKPEASVQLIALGPTRQLQTQLPDPQWTSSDSNVVMVVNGWVFGETAGSAIITARSPGKLPDIYRVKVAAGSPLVPAPAEPSPVKTFITRRGNQLLENDKPFRFISWNVPNLHVIEDASWRQLALLPKSNEPFYWHRVTAAEQEDAVESVAQMGGQIIRCYTLSISGGRRNKNGPSHYTGPDSPLNEDLMQDYDRMIAICGKHGVRLILPIIDEWDWFGGRKEFAALSGGGDFYTNRKVISDFKTLIEKLVNRNNTVTGIPYKDDPTIMAWETGNELQHVPKAWTAEIAAWIKQQAPNQLVSDGANGSIESLDDPNVDLVTDHFYGRNDYIARALASYAKMGAKKVFFIGEFGCTDPDMELGTMEVAMRNNISGALFWSLRFHSADGGFYWHDQDGEFSAYHWPGFSRHGSNYENRVLNQTRNIAWAIRGCLPPPRTRPAAPAILPFSTPHSIAWIGSVGAEQYLLERSQDGVNWDRLDVKLDDSEDPFKPYNDSTAPANNTLYYRIKAVNQAGESPWSPPLTLKAK